MATEADYKRLGAWAVMLNEDANIDRHGRKRTVPMKVLSLGFSRTGTQSMQEALTILGYPTYHFSKIFENVRDADVWEEALRAQADGRAVNWKQMLDQVLGDYEAMTDAPAILFWRELLESYPDAKVVLVERDMEKWHPSVRGLWMGALNPFATYVLRFTDPFWFGRVVSLTMTYVKSFTGTSDPAKAVERAPAKYRAYYADIRAGVPKDRMLEYQLGSGWEPLCSYLGKEVPNAPFPHRNEAAMLEASIMTAIKKSMKRSLFNVAAVVGVAAVLAATARNYMM